MKCIKIFAIFLMFLPLMTGCSVYMATQQPEKKDINVLNRGTPRNHVIAELGKPSHTKNEDGKTCDVFVFVQGYSTGVKAGRAVFHGAADILTLGLWEVVGTPVEAVADGDEVKCEVFYDESERVDYIAALDTTQNAEIFVSYLEKSSSCVNGKQSAFTGTIIISREEV